MGNTTQQLAVELQSLLNLQTPPLAITFTQQEPEGVSRYQSTMPAPAADGRTGAVPAGCVFWMKAVDRTFTTCEEDHANCSVGSVTHGFKTTEDVGGCLDVATLLQSGWVTMEMVPHIPVVKTHYNCVTYGPAELSPIEPDVVFMRVNAKQAMVMSDALPDLRYEGKPQCHIIAIAKEQNEVALSVGCMLSRVRTGMPNTEMTCAIPATRLGEVVERLRQTCKADTAVATYAAEDSSRFSAPGCGA